MYDDEILQSGKEQMTMPHRDERLEYLLSEIEAAKRVIVELSDEQLEAISGGGFTRLLTKAKVVYEDRFQLHPGNIIPAIKNKIQTARSQSSSNRGINVNGR